MKFTGEALSGFIATLSATIVVVPGHPEKGPLYLVHGLLNVIRKYGWESGSDGKARGLLAVLSMLAALSQDTLPYRLPKGIFSNSFASILFVFAHVELAALILLTLLVPYALAYVVFVCR